MRSAIGRLAILAASAVLAATALTGCQPTATTPSPTGSTTPSAEPVFASDEEALKAATEAYAAYLRTSDQILADGGNSPERIREYSSEQLAEIEIAGYADIRAKGYRSIGSSRYDNLALQSVDASSRSGTVTVYVCSDVSAVDVVDAQGQSVVSADRPTRTPFQVTFDLAATDPARLVVASAEVWNGPGICS